MDSPRQITALVIPPGDDPAYLTRIEPRLESLQEIVGGFVEPLTLSGDATMYLNEEGKYTSLPVNGNANRVVYLADPGLHPEDYVVGQVVVVGNRDAQGRNDGQDHDVPDSVVDLSRRAGLVVETHPTVP